MDNSDLKWLIRTLFQKVIGSSDLDFAGSESTSGRGPN